MGGDVIPAHLNIVSPGLWVEMALRFVNFRKLLGTLILDMPKYLLVLWVAKSRLLSLANRKERLIPAPDGRGYRCDWQWTSDLHAPKVFPFLGRRLMKLALVDHPIRRLPQLENYSGQPVVSFIIGHRGTARLSHLLATLESIAGQQDASVECIVVEQEMESQLGGHLPPRVRHIHTPPPVSDMPYCRSWAFNIGVKQARGNVLVLHDNDMLVPADYAAQALERVKQGYEVLNLKRFIFYLGRAHSEGMFDVKATLLDDTPEAIVQNLEGGGSVVITREAFERIGGMDESFIGWGGEDNEFWERAQTCKVWPYGYLPIVHLWHPSQPGKYQGENPTLRHYRDLSLIPEWERIVRLASLGHGDMAGPHGYQHGRAQG